MDEKPILLVDIIRENPGCVLTLDNDCWWIHAAKDENSEEEDYDREPIASSEFFYPDADSDDRPHVYGLGVLYALARAAGLEVEWC